MNVYEITEEMRMIEQKFNELEEKGELTTEDNENYEEIKSILENMLEEKQKNIIALIKNKKNLMASMEEEEKRLYNNRKRIKNELERIESLLIYILDTKGIKKITTELGNITLANKPPRVEIVNEEVIPKEFIKIQEVKKVDKTAIKNLIKETGELVDGVKFVTGDFSLRIK